MDSFVKDLKDGKPGAFDELVLKYKNKIYALSLSILRNPSDAEDAGNICENFQKYRLVRRKKCSIHMDLYDNTKRQLRHRQETGTLCRGRNPRNT